MLKSKLDERKIIEDDIDRMKNNLNYLALERAQVNKELNNLQTQFNATKTATDALHKEIEDLHVSNSQLQKRVYELESLLEDSKYEINTLTGKVQNAKMQVQAESHKGGEFKDKYYQEVGERQHIQGRV